MVGQEGGFPDISRAYKPYPEAYRKPAALLGLDPGEIMLAAAHNSDPSADRRPSTS